MRNLFLKIKFTFMRKFIEHFCVDKKRIYE